MRDENLNPPPPPPPEPGEPAAEAPKGKRPWRKPVLFRMSYVDITTSGPHQVDQETGAKYRTAS